MFVCILSGLKRLQKSLILISPTPIQSNISQTTNDLAPVFMCVTLATSGQMNMNAIIKALPRRDANYTNLCRLGNSEYETAYNLQ